MDNGRFISARALGLPHAMSESLQASTSLRSADVNIELVALGISHAITAFLINRNRLVGHLSLVAELVDRCEKKLAKFDFNAFCLQSDVSFGGGALGAKVD